MSHHSVHWIAQEYEPLLELPDKTIRAGNVLGFDSNGQPRAQQNGAVGSVFGRSGDVSAAFGDFSASQVKNDSGLTGLSVKDALINLEVGKAAVGHGHDGEYEPVFLKGTAFNKNFGGSGSVSEVARSDHGHVSVEGNNILVGRALLWAGTRSDYDAIPNKDANTVYFIVS